MAALNVYSSNPETFFIRWQRGQARNPSELFKQVMKVKQRIIPLCASSFFVMFNVDVESSKAVYAWQSKNFQLALFQPCYPTICQVSSFIFLIISAHSIQCFIIRRVLFWILLWRLFQRGFRSLSPRWD